MCSRSCSAGAIRTCTGSPPDRSSTAPRPSHYLCPFDEEEGEQEGVPEALVRLDEVLAEAGDTLAYGADGIKLTSAGYLPPVHVAAAFTELDLAEEWIGQGNREADTWPVLHLRESAQKLGLLRKHRGEQLCTARGRALRDDPAGLWWHLAEKMPVCAADPFASQAATSRARAAYPKCLTGTGPLPATTLTNNDV
jgi:hypothetical protein